MAWYETLSAGGGGGVLGTLAGLFGISKLIKRTEKALDQHKQEDKAKDIAITEHFERVVHKDTCTICQVVRDTQHNEVKNNFKDLKKDMKENFKDFKADVSKDMDDMCKRIEKAVKNGGN